MSKRLKFFFGHFAISILIAMIAICTVFLLWYPSPLAKAVGVTNIFLMLVVIDVILGPVLGFLVYKASKKTLKMDLAVIILLQVSALSYGMYNIAQARPTWIVQYGDRFELVRNNDIVRDNIDQADKKYKTPSWFKPQFVTIKKTNTIEAQNKELFAEITSGISLSLLPEKYIDIHQANQNIRDRMQELGKLQQFNDKSTIHTILKVYPDVVGWMPLKANVEDMTVLIDENGGVVKIVDLRPW